MLVVVIPPYSRVIRYGSLSVSPAQLELKSSRYMGEAVVERATLTMLMRSIGSAAQINQESSCQLWYCPAAADLLISHNTYIWRRVHIYALSHGFRVRMKFAAAFAYDALMSWQSCRTISPLHRLSDPHCALSYYACIPLIGRQRTSWSAFGSCCLRH